MENIVIFLGTVALYLTAIVCVDSLYFNKPIWNYSWKRCAKMLALVALLTLPLNINGNVFTIAGNATAEKSVYSIFSFYQSAGQDVLTIFGLAGYQQAGQDAETTIGLAGYQNAGRDTMTALGLAGYQNAGRNAVTALGLAGYQRAERNAIAGMAIALYQRVGEKTRAFGAFSALTKD